MSLIFGILRLDNRGVKSDSLSLMRQAMTCFESNRNRSGLWKDTMIGLGHLMGYNTLESLQETLPLKSQSEDLVLTVAGRLDNREKLSATLEIDYPERVTIPNSQFILKAYQKWGIRCPQYLLGDWVFALWDKEKQRLLISADHFGGCGLYYYQAQGIFAFSSSIKGILALPEVSHRLNPIWIAQSTPEFPKDNSTAYEGIYRMLPGHCLVVTATRINIQPYWHPREIQPVRLKTDQDYLDAFLEIYTEAVRCRLRSHRPIGVTLSGGLDSGSVATLAARELGKMGQRLTALSSVPLYGNLEQTVSKNQFGDETPFIEATCQQAENIDLFPIQAKQITPLAGIRRMLEIHEQPNINAGNLYWMIDLYEVAQQSGLGTLLIGSMGNLTISSAGNRNAYLLNLLAKGQLRRYLQEVKAWQTVNQASWLKTLKSQLLAPWLPTQWKSRYRSSNSSHSIIRTEPARAAMKNYQSPIPTADLSTLTNGSAYGAICRVFYQGGYNGWWSEQGFAFGLEIRDPTADKRLIEFCLGIPEDQYTRQGQQRLLIRRAMKGLMPEKVLWNNFRGRQAADIVYRVRASQEEIAVALNTLQSSPLAQEWLDLSYMNQVFTTCQHQLSPQITNEVVMMLKGIIIGLFLQRFEN